MRFLLSLLRAGIAAFFLSFLFTTPTLSDHDPVDIVVELLESRFYPEPDMEVCEPVVREYFAFVTHNLERTQERQAAYSLLREAFTDCFDPYTQFGTPEMYTQFQESQETRFVGVGVVVRQHQDGGFVIADIYEGSSLFGQAGLGEVIVGAREIDDADYVSLTLVDFTVLMDVLRGEVGTQVSLQIRRRDGTEYEIVVTRREFRASTVVDSRMLPGNVGYIKISRFNGETADDFQEALLEMTGVTSVIIDLRDNPGGDVSGPVELGYYFSRNLDDVMVARLRRSGQSTGTIRDPFGRCIDHPERMIGPREAQRCPTFTFRGHQLEREIISEDYKEPGIFADYRVIILTNGSSASSSELFTAMMQDWGSERDGQFIVVGEQTFGKAIGQTTFPISSSRSSEGFLARFTDVEYLMGNGLVRVHGVGVTPNVVVVDTRTSPDTPDAEDAQLQSALDILRALPN